jgi:predicted branched-subunit amino acid permease
MTSALLGTAAGYLAAGALPRPVRFGLVFLNPVFFALIFADARDRAAVLALLIGALAGPLLHLVSPDWGVLASGMIAGSAAFWLARALPAGQRGS